MDFRNRRILCQSAHSAHILHRRRPQSDRHPLFHRRRRLLPQPQLGIRHPQGEERRRRRRKQGQQGRHVQCCPVSLIVLRPLKFTSVLDQNHRFIVRIHCDSSVHIFRPNRPISADVNRLASVVELARQDSSSGSITGGPPKSWKPGKCYSQPSLP